MKRFGKTNKIIASMTSHPNMKWTPGMNQPKPFENGTFKSFDPNTISSYSLLISGVVPRPVAFVSTQSIDGVGNLAPFSYFSAVSHDPPVVCVGICNNRDGSKKDTLVNIETTKEFVVNIISDWFVESANYTSGAFKPNVDEGVQAGLTYLPSDIVAPKRVNESAFHMECRLSATQEIRNDKGDLASTVVFGRVVRFHVLEPLLEEGPSKNPQVKYEGYRPLGRLGGDKWVSLGDHIDIPRPRV
jgi:flavin reductase (DIM6/NTAB) family NADH-FMN oxidoreductase RutF